MTEAKTSEKRHYYLFTGELIINDPNSDQLQCIRLNAVNPCKQLQINAAALGLAQTAMQKQFYERQPADTQAQVLEVLIINISYLGHMTNEEFIYQEPTKAANLAAEAEALASALGVVGAHVDNHVLKG